jgi:Protein of unknown function (DUF3105)
MSSRQEEKQRRREERLAKEKLEAAAAARKNRLGLVAAGLLGAAAVAAVIIAIAAAAGGGGDDKNSVSPSASNIPNKPVPAQQISDLDAAAKAADCTVKTYPSEGRSHVTTAVTYKTNPPTSGNHNPNPSDDGTYAPGQTPAKENYVHTLEHGRIEIQYAPNTLPTRIGQLQTLMDQDSYHAMLFENNTQMPFAVAATAWTHLLGCKKFTDKSFDAIRAFRKRYTDQAPEAIP